MIFLTGKKIYLRPYVESDVDFVASGHNDELVRETLFLFFPMTIEQMHNQLTQWVNSKDTVLFTICRCEDYEPVGQTAFVRIDYVSRAAIFYIAIYKPKYWSMGYGSEATQLMVKYGFDILNLNRIQLHVASENIKGIKAYEKAGFKMEGTLRQAMYHHNRYVDFYVMGILRDEYYEMIKNQT